jgi:tetratricopeptide (TPR) repeat protein
MKKAMKRAFTYYFILILIFAFHTNAFSQQSPLVKKGIEHYKNANYKEAIETFTKARNEDPRSSTAAFFLGMAYKQTMDYEKAFGNLKDAVTLTPRIKEALAEVIDVAMQIGNIVEAKKWVDVAEKENISPAKIAFLKGLIFTEEGKNKEAAEAFEKAKSINPKISQAADIQIALSYMRDRELKKAKKSFESAILSDPQSDLAGFARQYLASVEQRLAAEKPFRYTISLFGQYDDNMVLKPDEQSLATGITNEGSRVLNSSFRVNYVPVLKGPWLFSAQYAFASGLHDKNVHTHDSMSNSISVTPGYNFGDFALNLAISYNHALVRRPSYKRYSGSFRAGPLVRVALKGNQLLEVFMGYTNNEIFQFALAPEEDRDSHGYGSYLSWVWLFKENSFLNLRYQSSRQDTDGRNWDNRTNGFSANLAVPVHNRVKLQLSGQTTKQDFDHRHTTFNIIREDKTYSFSGGLSWQWLKNVTVVAQYSRIMADSNIGIYDYTRNLYTLGMEYRF